MKTLWHVSLVGLMSLNLVACGSSSSSESSNVDPACSESFRNEFDGLVEAFARAKSSSPSSATVAEASRVCTAFLAKHGAGNCRAYSNDKKSDVVVLGGEIRNQCDQVTATAKANAGNQPTTRPPETTPATDTPTMRDFNGSCTSAFISAYNSALIQLNFLKNLTQLGSSKLTAETAETVKKCDAVAKYGKGTCAASSNFETRISIPTLEFENACEAARSLIAEIKRAQEQQDLKSGKQVPLTELKPAQISFMTLRADELNAELNAAPDQKKVFARSAMLAPDEVKSDDIFCRLLRPRKVAAKYPALTQWKVAAIEQNVVDGAQVWTFKTTKQEIHVVCQAPEGRVLTVGDIRLALDWILSLHYSK